MDDEMTAEEMEWQRAALALGLMGWESYLTTTEVAAILHLSAAQVRRLMAPESRRRGEPIMYDVRDVQRMRVQPTRAYALALTRSKTAPEMLVIAVSAAAAAGGA